MIYILYTYYTVPTRIIMYTRSQTASASSECVIFIQFPSVSPTLNVVQSSYFSRCTQYSKTKTLYDSREYIYHTIPNYKYYIICIANLCVFYDTYTYSILYFGISYLRDTCDLSALARHLYELYA